MNGMVSDAPVILITGASGGLGAALAECYAGPGRILHLSGRDAARLSAVAARARAKGALVREMVIDVRDAAAMTAWLEGLAELPDIVIANAGISGGTGARSGDEAERERAIFDVNVGGVLNTVLPLLDRMRRRGSGRIVLISSLAGFRGLPSAPAYCASKAMVRVWGEGLRGWLAADGVGVSVICPGFVDTPMTRVNRFPMPFLMDAEKAARIIRKGIDSGRARIAFPWPLAWGVTLLAALPPAWTDRLLVRLPRKDG